MLPRTLTTAFASLFLSIGLLLSGCGSAPHVVSGGDPVPTPLTLSTEKTSVVKMRPLSAGMVALTETPVSFFQPGPIRHLLFTDKAGVRVSQFEAPTGWSLLDFAVHPSNEVTAVLSSQTKLQLVRLRGTGEVISQAEFADPSVATDPAYDLAQYIHPDSSLQPYIMHDAARLASIGEEAVIAIRTGRNAVVVYRLRSTGQGFSVQWRTLVEPGYPILGRFVTSGTYDAMGQLENHLRVHLDADASGRIAVAVLASSFDEALEAHQAHFKESVPATTVYGVIVTRISSNGVRVGSTVVDTSVLNELHGLRLSGTQILLVGRVRTTRRPDGGGWDAYDALLRADDGAVTAFNVVDVAMGDVLFDMLPATGGGYIAGGTTNYTQNPSGASISEDADPLLAVLDAQGRLVRRAGGATKGPRHNSVHSLASAGSALWVGGMVNGPGTHSHDAAPDAITADGYVRSVDPATL